MSTAEAQRLCTEASDVVNQVFSKDDKAMFSCTFVGILKTLQEQRADLLVGCQKHYTECLKAPPPFEPKRKPNCANFNEEKLAKCKEVTRDDVLQCVREGLTAWKGMTCEKALSSEDVRVPTCDRVDAACPGLFEDEGR
jgi:hypothetical protein